MSLLDAAGVVTGDIWCTGAFSFESPLKDLLDSGEYTLEQLLAEDELLQELRGVHPELIKFFSTEEAVTGLIKYVIMPPGGTPPRSFQSFVNPPGNKTEEASATTEKDKEANNEGSNGETSPSSEEAEDSKEQKEPGKWLEGEQAPEENVQPERNEQDEKDMLYVRFPYMACEVICCEISGIVDTIVDGFVPASEAPGRTEEKSDDAKDPRPRPILDLLFSMLYDSQSGQIDDYRAGYFDKLLSVLFRKRPQAMSVYVNDGGGRGNTALMKAMFKHLYSHSIMQIVQRLLLPQPPLPQREEGDENEGEDLYGDALDQGDMDGLGAFRCNWSESDEALDMLLGCFIGDGSAIPEELRTEEQQRLSMFQNASEVLITIIQNSPLDSPTLKILTTDPVLEKLIIAGSTLESGEDFSPHDSKVTCAMNVLESLILQLGGYGSVGGMMPEEEEAMLQEIEESTDDPEEREARFLAMQAAREENYATCDALIEHLPMMLKNLSDLLQHPSCEKWLSPMQFSSEPQRLLGSSRLRIVRLLESLVLLGDPNVDALLCDSDCLEVCLNLFWKFQWCSMLHQSVANLLVHVFEGANARAELQSYFMVNCNLLGRLMDSFWDSFEEGETESRRRASTTEKEVVSANAQTADTDIETGSADKPIPVSDDDVDAALEQEALNKPGRRGEPDNAEGTEQVGASQPTDDKPPQSNIQEPLPAQSFRLGYMGHVIIICQALVHACTNDPNDQSEGDFGSEDMSVGDGNEEGDGDEEANGNMEDKAPRPQAPDQEPEANDAAPQETQDESADPNQEESPDNPLILAQLVDTHPLRSNWEEFVSTTLAQETAIQSTPLGGFQGNGMDPLQSHRPGLADDGEYEADDGAAPPMPPRGLLVGGDVIDMDDNDLDIAASMMAGLSMSGGGNATGAIDQAGKNPGEYEFDDPLGNNRFGDDNEDEGSHSSDEESGKPGGSSDSGDNADDDAPVMDLFAGNRPDAEPDSNGFANFDDNFANFDDAFAEAGGSLDNAADKNGSDADEIFGGPKDHAELLEDEDAPDAKASGTNESQAVEESSESPAIAANS
jgi:hypothetical protein